MQFLGDPVGAGSGELDLDTIVDREPAALEGDESARRSHRPSRSRARGSRAAPGLSETGPRREFRREGGWRLESLSGALPGAAKLNQTHATSAAGSVPCHAAACREFLPSSFLRIRSPIDCSTFIVRDRGIRCNFALYSPTSCAVSRIAILRDLTFGASAQQLNDAAVIEHRTQIPG